MAYADGFWALSMRNAVGAVARTDAPFANWFRGSTLALPVFVLAVLGALTVALRRYGPELGTPRAGALTALMAVAAGTTVAILASVASSAYDYHLQAGQLSMVAGMHGGCGVDCLARQRHMTLAAHARGLGYVSALLLVTNLVLVGWVVAVLGGRLRVSATRRLNATAPGLSSASRRNDVRLIVIVCLLGSVVIHAAVAGDHLAEWTAAGVFFVLLVAVELAVAGLMGAPLARRAWLERATLIAAAAVSIGPLLLWLYSRTAGLPFGPEPGTPERIAVAECAACALEVVTLISALGLLRAGAWLHRPAASAHVRGLAIVAVIAITTIGLAGAAPTLGLGQGGSNSPEPVTHHR